jgi:tetratricopeptide (TPR) repeat protein
MLLAVLSVVAASWWTWRWYADPGLPEFHLEDADIEVAAAVRWATDSVREHPRSAEAWGQLGMVLLANKFEAESILPLSRAESLEPSNPRWSYLQGIALWGRDPDEAIPCFRRAVAACQPSVSDSTFGTIHLRLAETLAAEGHAEEAATHFRKVSDGPLAPCADYGLGVLAIVSDNLPAAKDHLVRSANSPLTRQKATVQLASLSRRLGEDEAKYSQRARELPPDPPWPDALIEECLKQLVGKQSRIQHATTLEQQGQVDAALEVLRKVAEDYPEAQSFLTAGILLGRRGHYQESEAYLRHCLQLEPELLRAQYYLSLALFAQGEMLVQQGQREPAQAKLLEAADWARRATELSPRYGEAHFQLGLTLYALQRRRDAIAAFRKAVATRPELADSHLWLGRALAEEGEFEEATPHLRNAQKALAKLLEVMKQRK